MQTRSTTASCSKVAATGFSTDIDGKVATDSTAFITADRTSTHTEARTIPTWLRSISFLRQLQE